MLYIVMTEAVIVSQAKHRAEIRGLKAVIDPVYQRGSG
jgi:hypothetical protein